MPRSPEGLRIAIYHNLPSGGAMRTAYETTRRLVARHTVDLFSLTSAAHEFLDLRQFADNSTIWPFSAGHLFASPFGRLNQAIRLVDLARQESLLRHIGAEIDRRGYDVVLVHPCMYTQSPSVLAHTRTPTVYYCQESLRQVHEPPIRRSYDGSTWRRRLDRVDPLRGLYYACLARADRRNARAATMVMANSEFSRGSIREAYGVDAYVNHLGVDTARFQPQTLPRSDWVFSAGALLPIKGFDFLIEALGTMRPELRPQLVIAANFSLAQERAYLQQLADQRGVRVDIRTPVDPAKMPELYGSACLTVYAPVREPLGLVALESQACATPVVGVREGGVTETVRHGETGLLAERDPGAFGEMVARLLQDREERGRLGAAGPAHIAGQWTWDHTVRRLEAKLAETAQRGRNPKPVGGRP